MSDLRKELSEYTKSLNKASNDSNINNAMSRAVKSYRENVANAMERYPHTEELAQEVRKIKDYSMKNNEQLLLQAMDVIEKNKGKAYFAKDKDEAIKIANEIIGTGKVIVKGKSMLGEE